MQMKSREKLQVVKKELENRIIGQNDVVEAIIASILLNGHSIITGVPGLAKTMLVKLVSEMFELSFNRIQFTPDLMPSDILGTEIIETEKESGKRFFKFIKGPVFTNILLADEINRTPPKTQAALLEAMQEKKVTANGKIYELDAPFIVFATRNPIEQEGTYPLPEAQLDRFLFSINITYPSFEDELKVIKTDESEIFSGISVRMDKAELFELQEDVRNVEVSDFHYEYALKLARRTRKESKDAYDFVKKYLSWGIGTRGAKNLIDASKAFAFLDNREHVEREDIKKSFYYVANHRLITNFYADSEKITVTDIIKMILERADD